VSEQIAFAVLLVIACSVEVSFYKLWIPIFPIVVLRGHISPCPCLCLWFRCVGTRKSLRQAVHEGFISLSLSDKSIILCFTPLIVYESMRDPFGSLDDSSPLSLQFSNFVFPLSFMETLSIASVIPPENARVVRLRAGSYVTL
jgi:hypothetical protein